MATSGGGTAGGNLLQALAPDKPDIRFSTIDPARQARLASLWGQYDTSANPAGNADYLAAYAAATPQAKQIAGSNIDWLNRYATGGYDPTKSYTDILGANQAALGNFLINPALNELTRQRKAAQARAGYGGQGTGTYDQLLQDRTLQALASQAVPNLLGNTTQAYGTAAGLENQNILNRLGIIGSGEQYNQLNVPALRYLEPTRLARSDIRANLGNLGAIANQEDLNRAYYRKRSGLEKAGGALNAFQSGLVNEANQALDLYAKAYTGGALGGMGGGGGGGGDGGGGGNWDNFTTQWGNDRLRNSINSEDLSGTYLNQYDDRPYLPPSSPNTGLRTYGHAGGAGGMSTQQLIQLLMSVLAKQGGGANQ